MTIEFLSTALLGISLITGLTVEALKKILTSLKIKYSCNILAVITSIVISFIVSVLYMIVKELPCTTINVVGMIALMFLSFLVTTIGYDKVIQTVKQFIKSKDSDDENKK